MWGPQPPVTLVPNQVVSQVKLLNGRKVRQVGRQRFGTVDTNCVASEAQLLEGSEVFETTRQ